MDSLSPIATTSGRGTKSNPSWAAAPVRLGRPRPSIISVVRATSRDAADGNPAGGVEARVLDPEDEGEPAVMRMPWSGGAEDPNAGNSCISARLSATSEWRDPRWSLCSLRVTTPGRAAGRREWAGAVGIGRGGMGMVGGNRGVGVVACGGWMW